MTPFEIALSIRNRPDDEEIESFVRRQHANERMVDFAASLELLIGWERAIDEFKSLMVCLAVVNTANAESTIAAAIARKRALGYDPKLEAVLARRWRCPHCKQFSNITTIEISVAVGELFRCCCGELGIYPIEAAAKLKVQDGGKTGLRPL